MNHVYGTMAQLGLLILLGCVLRNRAMLSHQGIRELSSLAVNITCPLLVIASVCRVESADSDTVLLFFGLGATIYLLLPFFAHACTALLHVAPDERGAYDFMFIFANTELLGFPIVQALFGDEAIFYTAIIHMPFDLLAYSYGLRLMSGERQPFELRTLWNPGFLLTVLAIAIYFSGIQVPDILSDTCYLIGNITTPISMLILGGNLAEIAWRRIFTDGRLYAMAAVRLAVVPSVIYVLLTALGRFSPTLVGIATVTFGMPVGSMIVMFANERGYQTELSTRAVSLTTLGSLLTIPLMAWWF